MLVLFAPQADDARLIAQREDIENTRAAFDDRDMDLVLVVGPLGSADSRPLSPADAAALRRSLKAPDGGFALRLVGKDGGTKRAADTPVPMKDLYALIDTMPMRRAEVRARRR